MAWRDEGVYTRKPAGKGLNRHPHEHNIMAMQQQFARLGLAYFEVVRCHTAQQRPRRCARFIYIYAHTHTHTHTTYCAVCLLQCDCDYCKLGCARSHCNGGAGLRDGWRWAGEDESVVEAAGRRNARAGVARGGEAEQNVALVRGDSDVGCECSLAECAQMRRTHIHSTIFCHRIFCTAGKYMTSEFARSARCV